MAPLLATRPRVDRSFERLYSRHALDVYRYALGVLRNPADAEDVTQTTFLNAYRALERGEQPRAPQNWLIAIAHNVCRQRFRAAARRPLEVELDTDVADRYVDADDPAVPSPEDIRRALGHLAFNQRAAIVMREIEGRSYADIAEVLGISLSAVETLLFRARRALREQLEASFTCEEAERAISRQADGQLARPERSQLRAHLRECAECRRLARRQRAQRVALRAFGGVPLPSSLAGLFGGGGAAVGAGVVAKAAAVVVAAGVAGGIGYDVHHALRPRLAQPAAAGRRAPTAAPVALAAGPAAAPVASATVARAARPEPRRHATPAASASHAPTHEHRQQQLQLPTAGQRAAHGNARGHESNARPAGAAAAAPARRPERQRQHGRGHAGGRGKGHARGQGAAQPQAPPTSQGNSGAPAERQPHQPAGNSPAQPQAPSASGTMPAAGGLAPGLAKKIEEDGASIPAGRHLHP